MTADEAKPEARRRPRLVYLVPLFVFVALATVFLIRLETSGDLAWATDADGSLDRELLAGVSVGGNVVGPWQTLVAFDIGVPVAGPADDFTARIAFLKLFK